METIRTKDIIPVDLNCVLSGVEFSLSYLHAVVNSDGGDKTHATKARHFEVLARQRLSDIDALFWNNKVGFWCDFDLTRNEVQAEYYASSFFPLWIYSTFTEKETSINSGRAFETIKELGVLDFSGGLPTSLIESGEQWDFPNAWPPLQHIAVEAMDPKRPSSCPQNGLNKTNGLSSSSSADMQQSGKEVARRFLENAFISWKKTGNMYEKYDVTEYGKAGHGGEYDVQEGFGWTNGVILDFLAKYGHELTAPKIDEKINV